MRKIKYVAHAARWFDKVNGNTYHSVRIQRVKDSRVIFCKFQYGYGDQYRQTALEAMEKEKWLPVKYRGQNENGSDKAMNFERENNYQIEWIVTDGLKRDCIRNGSE